MKVLFLFLLFVGYYNVFASIERPFGFEPIYQEGSQLSYINSARELVSVFPPNIFGNELSGFSFGARLLPQNFRSITYEVKFPEDFDFVKGGKLPGLCGEPVASGGNRADGKNGFSARVMWRTDGRAVSYIYHLDQVDRYGDDFQWHDSDKNPLIFKRGIWHKIKMNVQVNDLMKRNGLIQVFYNDRLVFEKKDFVFRTVNSISVDRLCFNTFFGGDDQSWSPKKEEKLFIRNLSIH